MKFFFYLSFTVNIVYTLHKNKEKIRILVLNLLSASMGN